MTSIKFFSSIVFLLCLCCYNEVLAHKKIIVIMIDGCRWDAIDNQKANLKGIHRMIHNGVRASYMYPVYPALSYPNWYSLATGLYPENHGFINNVMYDNDTDTMFSPLKTDGSPDLENTEAYWWNEAEPIWITAEKKGLRTALYWWAGCEVQIKDAYPSICERHRFGPGTEHEKIDFLERIDDIIEMFKPVRVPNSWKIVERLSLALMYYGPVDYNGHYFGPDSPQTLRALQDMDDILYKTQEKLAKAGLDKEVNIIVFSDHGMTDIRKAKHISLQKFAPMIKLQIQSVGGASLFPKEGMLDQLYNELKDAKIKGLKVFKKQDIPIEYHIKKHRRIPPILLVADKGYYIDALNDSTKWIGERRDSAVGHHGYDPYAVSDMRGLFFAAGPNFRKGQRLDYLHITDIYNMMCNILQIDPLPNNGTWDRVKSLIRSDDEVTAAHSHAAVAGLTTSCALIVSTCFSAFISFTTIYYTFM